MNHVRSMNCYKLHWDDCTYPPKTHHIFALVPNILLTMQFLWATGIALLLAANSAFADFLAARSLDDGENVDLGFLEDVNIFYSILGLDTTGNTTHWNDASEIETLDLEEVFEGLGAGKAEPGLITSRDDDSCGDLTGILQPICNRMPRREVFWVAGGALAIAYSPRVVKIFLAVRVEENVCKRQS